MDQYQRITQANIGTTGSRVYDTDNLLWANYSTDVQGYSYTFDPNTGNLSTRINTRQSKREDFEYDADKLDRLTKVTDPSNLSVDYTTNKNGNIQTKSDAGTFVYDATQPYAVDKITSGLNISPDAQAITYFSFGKVKKITEGTGVTKKTADFDYIADYQCIRMVLKTNGRATKTRYYFGGSCEREVVAGVTTQYIWIGGDAYTAVGVDKKVGTGSWTVYNIFRDHLGTITHLKNGSTIDEYSFDAWGRRRDKDDWTMTLTSEPTLFADRGFTAHEYLEDFKLYNMNGRLYDPVVGRFLSADPYIQDPGFTQSLNRYSYCLNNPLKYIDPSGNTWWSHFTNWTRERFDKLGGWMNENNVHINFNTIYNPVTNRFNSPYMVSQMPTWDVPYTMEEQRAYAEANGILFYKGSIWKRVPIPSDRDNWFSNTYNSALGRMMVPDFIAIGGGFNAIGGVGGASSIEFRWVTHGPEASWKPMITVTESIGGGFSVDGTLNIEAANYIGNVNNIRRRMMQTNTFTGDFPTIWGSAGVGAGGKIGVTGYITPNVGGSVIIGRELNIGAGLPAGSFPVNGAGGTSNTWILHDFY